MAKKIAIIYITCKDRSEAGKIAVFLLRKRLIACANIFPISSLYWWKGKIKKGKEAVLIGKSMKANRSKIIREVTLLHSYDIPCVMVLDSQSDGNFAKWVEGQVRLCDSH